MERFCMKKPHENWFDRADSDLKFADVGLREGFHSQVCFLSQQAVEKALKGYLVSKDILYPKTHKLLDLSRLCRLQSLSVFENQIKLLDQFYIPVRYPDSVPGGLASRMVNENDAKEAFEAAQGILQAVFSSIK